MFPHPGLHRLGHRARQLRVAHLDPGRHRRGARRDDRARRVVPAHRARARRAAAPRPARHHQHVRQRAQLSVAAALSGAARSATASASCTSTSCGRRAPASATKRTCATSCRATPTWRRTTPRCWRASSAGIPDFDVNVGNLPYCILPEVGLAHSPRRAGDGDQVLGRRRARRRDEQVRVARRRCAPTCRAAPTASSARAAPVSSASISSCTAATSSSPSAARRSPPSIPSGATSSCSSSRCSRRCARRSPPRRCRPSWRLQQEISEDRRRRVEIVVRARGGGSPAALRFVRAGARTRACDQQRGVRRRRRGRPRRAGRRAGAALLEWVRARLAAAA